MIIDRLPRLTLRIRLTLVYGALFLAAGLTLLGVTYLLFNQQLAQSFADRYGGVKDGQKEMVVINTNGHLFTGPEAVQWLQRQEEELRSAAATSLLTQGAVALAVVGGAAAGLGWVVAGGCSPRCTG